MDRGGFEPPKSKTSDLQSDPFGRSGICPILYAFLFRGISVTCRRKGWCLKVESNRRQRDFQSLALPTELSRQDFFSFPDRSSFVLKYYFSTGKRVKKWRPKRGSNSWPPAWQAGALTNWAIGPYSFKTFSDIWWAFTDSNRGPIGYEPTALTTELKALACPFRTRLLQNACI